MSDQFCFCPICHTRKVNVGGEGDDVDYTCDHCGGHFKAGEARRGHLYFEAEATERRIAGLEKRLKIMEDRILGFDRRFL